MTPKERVLKFDRSDADSENTYVLLNAKSKGPKPLDLKLEAIDFESCFVHTLKHDKVGSLRVKSCPVSDSEWQNILEKLFDQEPQPEIHATASVSEGSITLVVRKSVEGITQRLGSITIPGTETQLNFLEWAGTAVDALAEVKKTASEATVKVDQLETDVKELKSQLEELIQAKDDDETAMLLKFRDLLNEKKVKIREQQKALASASTKRPNSSQSQQTSQPPPQPSQTSLPSRSRKPQQSRSSKRKQPSPPAEESSDDGFEQMEVDKVKEEEETDKGAETDATASTASDSEDEEPARSASQANTATSSQRQGSLPKNTKGQPPPKRALPFVKDKSKPAAAASAPKGGSETESDDEL